MQRSVLAGACPLEVYADWCEEHALAHEAQWVRAGCPSILGNYSRDDTELRGGYDDAGSTGGQGGFGHDHGGDGRGGGHGFAAGAGGRGVHGSMDGSVNTVIPVFTRLNC